MILAAFCVGVRTCASAPFALVYPLVAAANGPPHAQTSPGLRLAASYHDEVCLCFVFVLAASRESVHVCA